MLTRPNTIIYFCIGWFLTMMSLLVGFAPWYTYQLGGWQIEMTAAVFLGACCLYWIARPPENIKPFSRDEIRFIIVPIVLFICWSTFSALWAPSWKSAVHHTLVWGLYLIFYLAVRQILETQRGFRYLAITLLAALAIISYAAVANYIPVVIFGGFQTLGRHAKYGEQIVTILPMLLVVVVGLKDRAFWIGTVWIALLWLLIFCTSGRINLLLFGVGFVVTAVLVLTHRSRRNIFNAETAGDAEDSNGSSDNNVFPISASSASSAFKKLLIITTAVVISPVLVQMFSLLSDQPAAAPMTVQRLTDNSALENSNDFRKLMIGISKEMILSHPLAGIGADNFGFETNNYREQYASLDPDNVSLAQSEDNLPERAHNEFLQITAELGVVGGAIALWIVAGILLMVWRAASGLTTGSLLGPAAVIGLGMFLVSSLVSSYSFRMIQNGLVFFFVLAVAAKFLMNEHEGFTLSIRRVRIPSAVGVVCCLLLIGYWTVRVASTRYTAQANYTQDLAEAERLYEAAKGLDNDNADASYYHGIRLLQETQYAGSIPHMSEAIRLGRARSGDFSYLATAHRLGGDSIEAELAMAAALKLYPRSVFVLARYAELLKTNGKHAESAAMLEKARSISRRDANTWWTFLNEGSNVAAAHALREPQEYKPLMELFPLNAVYAYLYERQTRFPKEKMTLDRLVPR